MFSLYLWVSLFLIILINGNDDREAIEEERTLIAELEEQISQMETRASWKNKTRIVKISERVGSIEGFLSPSEAADFLKKSKLKKKKKIMISESIRNMVSNTLYVPINNIAVFGIIDQSHHGKPYLRSDSRKGHFATLFIFLSSEGSISVPTKNLLRYTKSGKLFKTQRNDLCTESKVAVAAQEGSAILIYNHNPDLSLDRDSPLVYCNQPAVLSIDINYYDGNRNLFHETFIATRSPSDVPKGYEASAKPLIAKQENNEQQQSESELCTDVDVDVDKNDNKEEIITNKQRRVMQDISRLEREIEIALEVRRLNRTRLTKVLPRVAFINELLTESELLDLEERVSDDGTVSVANLIRSRISDTLYVPEASISSVAEVEIVENGIIKSRSDPKKGHLFSVYVFQSSEGRLLFPGDALKWKSDKIISSQKKFNFCDTVNATTIHAVRSRAAIVFHHNADLSLSTETPFALCDSPQFLTIHGNFYNGDDNVFYKTFIKPRKQGLPPGYRMPGKNRKKKNKKKPE